MTSPSKLTVTGPQLSAALTALVSDAGTSEAQLTVRFVGQSIVGGSLSTTITCCVHVLWLLLTSVAVQMTRLVPVPNVKSPGASLTTVDTPQLSLVASGTPRTTFEATHVPTVVFVSTLFGQVMLGGSLSLTIMVKVQLVVPQSLEAVQLTEFVPTGNALPEVGVQVTVGVGLPVALGLNVSVAEHNPTSVLVLMSLGQVMVGPAFAVSVAWQLLVQPLPSTIVTV